MEFEKFTKVQKLNKKNHQQLFLLPTLFYTATYSYILVNFVVLILKEITFTEYTVKDLFSMIKQINEQNTNLHMASFDIQL